MDMQSNTTPGSNWDWEIPSIDESRSDIPEGNYTMELVDVQGPYDNKYNPERPRYLFKFKVVDSPDDPDWLGKTYSQFFTLTSSPKGSLYPIYKALRGGNVDPSERWSPKHVMNKRMRVMIANVTPESGGEPRPKIQSALPVRERKVAAAAPPFLDDDDVVPF